MIRLSRELMNPKIAKQIKKVLLRVAAVVVLLVLLMLGSHRLLTRADKRAEASWRQLKRVSQRQLELVPELASLVKESFPGLTRPMRHLKTSHERLLERQAVLRAPITQDQLGGYEKTYSEMTTDLERIVKTVSDVQPFGRSRPFQEWVGQYQGTEQLLTLEKRRYNQLAAAYNRMYEAFFVHWVAERFKLQSRPLFNEHAIYGVRRTR